MKRFLLFVCAVLILGGASHAASGNYPPDNTNVQLTSTNLPIVWINVGGKIIDRHQRITASMKILHNGDGQLNYADTIAHPGQHIDYEGYIGLRYRGNSSYGMSAKKPYSFRPLDKPLESGGEKVKVKILGMGKDNDWALLAPYADKSMIRDLLAFEVSRPWMEYVPQGRLCELFLDGTYYGVYVLTEVVSKGKHRLNLEDPGTEDDEITGGYLMEVDRSEGMFYISRYHPVSMNGTQYPQRYIHIQYKSPDYEDLTQDQVKYITGRIYEMETALWNYRVGGTPTYRNYIDMMNFVDYQIAMEFGHNVDGYRLSGKFYKHRDSQDARFKMALWDMNLAYGNSNYYRGWRTDTWIYQNNDVINEKDDPYLIPFWWYKLNTDPDYVKALKSRWKKYRQSNLREDRLMATVDSLANVLTINGAESRNSLAWPRWRKYVWPNFYLAKNFQDEIDYLKQWLIDRLAWMDSQLGYDPTVVSGDVNGDGEVNIGDVNALIDIIMGNPDDTQGSSDVNSDDEVNIADINAVISAIMGN